MLLVLLTLLFVTTIADTSDLMRRLLDGESDFSSLFNEAEYLEITSKKVRKELSTLTDDEWDDFVDAMWIMKNTSQAEGELLYGKDFNNYDRFVCMHMTATSSDYGDQGHYNQVFLVWHRAFVLLFVGSLYAINPNLVIPYWDYRLEVGNNSSIVFTDDYFGSISSDDAEGTITSGRFAYWPVSHWDDVDPDIICNVDGLLSPFGYLRGRTNSNRNRYSTRFGGNLCGFDIPPGSVSKWDECLNNSYSNSSSLIRDFVFCMDIEVHAFPHVWVSGAAPYNATLQKTLIDAILSGKVDITSEDVDVTWCSNWLFNRVESNLMMYTPVQPILNCFDCPECDPLTDSEYPDCLCNNTGNTGNFNLEEDSSECMVSSNLSLYLYDREWQWKPGEMTDIQAGPNDPIFFLHHLNIDRYFMQFQLIYFDEFDNYYGYPESGANEGGNLNDVMNPDDPFVDIFFNDFGNSGPYTAKNILDYTTFLNADYTYDTILDLIKPSSSSDSSSDSSDSSDSR